MKERDIVQKIRDFIQDFDALAGLAVKKVVLPATLGLGLALGTGCGAADDDPAQTRPPATRAQKGDNGGIVALYAAPFPGDAKSCQDSCGAQAPGGCWCDDECATYGDCCDDKATLCKGGGPVALYAAPFPQPEYAAPFPEGPATCASGDTSYCGEQAPAGCWCDDGCATHGDCCDDKPTCEIHALYAAPFPQP